MKFYFCNDDFFFGNEHQIDIKAKQQFEIDNSLLELGFENDIILENYKNAMIGISDSKKIEILKKEIRHKVRANYKTIYSSEKLITVSDLSAYTFCPVSYAIKQTYEVEQEWELVYGIQEHEKQHLTNRIKKYDQSKNIENALEDIDIKKQSKENYMFFKDIFHSSLIFSGHENNERTNFYGKNKNIVGTPDYIFKNSYGQNFVVEEKFPTKSVRDEFWGFDNHKIQILSYLFALEKINAAYGYLIYWNKVLDLKSKFPLDCLIIKIDKTDLNKESLLKKFNEVVLFRKSREHVFNQNQINAKKCVNCSVNLYCKHKTGRYSAFTLPYDQDI